MRKILLSFVYCFLTVCVFGQQATWNALPANIKSWNYSFAQIDAAAPIGTTNAINPNVNGGSGTFAPAGSAGPIPLVYASTSADHQFLPRPTSGEISVRAGNSGRPVFTIDGTTDALVFNASTNGGTNLGKLSVIGASAVTAVTSINFKIKFNATSSDWILAIGSSEVASQAFTTTSTFAGTSAGTRDEVFTSFIWKEANGDLQYGYQGASGTASPTYTNIGTYAADTEYSLEFLCNNSATEQYYTKGGIQYTIPSRNLHFWINNVQIALSDGVYDFPSSVLATGKVIDSFMLQGRRGTTNTATISGLNIKSAASATVLPVSLTSFTGKNANNSVLLNWQTASESNNNHFDVLRSSDDDKTPVKIGEVKGNGNSTTLINYNFTDKQAITGNNYYQLRQVDNDGTATLHPQTVAVKVGLNTANFNVSADNNKNVIVNFYSDQTAKGTFTLSDINGRMIKQLDSLLTEGSNSISLYNQSLTSGVYVATLVVNGNHLAKKIIVK